VRSKRSTRGGGRKRILARIGGGCAALACAVLVTGAPAPLPTLPPALPTAIPSGYFRVENRDGIWWLIDPLGTATLSIGVDAVVYEGDRIRGSGASPYLQAAEKIYPDRAAWDRHALDRLRSWAFNTLGAWSDTELWDAHTPYTIILDFAARSGADSPRGAPVDVYDPRFEAAAREIARRAATPRAQDPMLVGYFSDNELWWGADWRRRGTLLGAYLSFPAGAPGRQQAIEFLRKRYGAVQRLNWAWHVHAPDFSLLPQTARSAAYRVDADAFLEVVAARYFSVCAQVIHSADPHHLYLGARFAGEPPDPVLRAARAADVVSINLYNRDPRPVVSRVFAITERPVLISEFSFRALDSGLPNTIGAGPWVFSQWGRAQAYMSYVARVESLPATIGYHWFRWADEPRQGRADGENSNYGLVSLTDSPYQEFLTAVTAANRAAIHVHRGAQRTIPSPRRPLWRTWSLQTVLDLILGGPRWLATVIRALSAYWAHMPPAAGT
jgi:hypothetical protein